MKIPVFVSCPTILNDSQQASRQLILDELDRFRLEPRALGRSDYPVDVPLREVLVLARRCAGGIILGFAQLLISEGVNKPGTPQERDVRSFPMPSPWNHIEAGI